LDKRMMLPVNGSCEKLTLDSFLESVKEQLFKSERC